MNLLNAHPVIQSVVEGSLKINLDKISFIYNYTKEEFLLMLNRCERAIKQKNKKVESFAITKEECEALYYNHSHKQGKLLNMIKRMYIEGTCIPEKPKPHSNDYKELMRIMNFYHEESLSLDDIKKLRKQLEIGECEIYNLFYINKFYSEGEELYHGRFFENYNEEHSL